MFDWYRKNPVETALWALGGAYLGIILALIASTATGHVTVYFG